MDLKGRFLFGNRSAEKVTGYTIEELLKMNMNDLIAPSYIKETENRLKKRKKGEKIQGPLQIEIIRKDGKHVPLEVITSPVVKDNKLVAIQGVARDITQYRKMQSDLEDAEKKWEALFERSLDWIYIHDLKGKFIDANKPALKGLGYSKEEISQINFSTLLPIKYLTKAYKVLRELKQTGRQKELSEFKLKRKDGKLVYVETKASVIYQKQKPLFVIGIARDITERLQMKEALERANKKLTKMALTDDLTGLLNHGASLNRLKTEVKRAERNKEPISVLMADLDYFKTINDEYGHPAGDKVLQQVSQNIRKSFRSYDIQGRYGGEEFLITMPNTKKKYAQKAAERLRKRFQKNVIKLNGDQVSCTISIGIVSCSPHKNRIGAKTLLKHADQALYKAKEKGRNRVEVCPDF
ncbi:MAG: diguanylate cyclase [Candidatus Aminicenantes bacterium]|nr:diguanylate cyclase [Candidatus Aminicenantes bacterium]